MDELTAETDLIGMTADIVSAFVSNNAIAADALPRLIAGVHGALAGTTQIAAPVPEPQAPAVYCLRYWCLCTRWAAPPRKRFCRLCIPLPASARWSASGPVSPVLPAAVRLRSARLPLWRLAL